ncbi:MAG: HK97 family phage prohead protease, partial [Planctomycetes bacterium]|nr:HK97 family phage prohead protease [Planctomycetota bacterium]
GWVKEDGSNLLEKIKDGRLKEVSIGAVVGRLVKENLDDDFFIAKDIKAMELSITPTPANVGTSIIATLKGLKEATNPNELKQVKPIFEKINDFNKDYVESLKPMVVSESRQMVETKIIEKFVCPMCRAIQRAERRPLS